MAHCLLSAFHVACLLQGWCQGKAPGRHSALPYGKQCGVTGDGCANLETQTLPVDISVVPGRPSAEGTAAAVGHRLCALRHGPCAGGLPPGAPSEGSDPTTYAV